MEAKDCLSRLIKFYEPYFKPSAEFRSKFLEKIANFSPSVIEKAYDHTCEYDNKAPALSSFTAYCYEFRDRENAERHKQQMENDRRTAEAVWKGDFGSTTKAKLAFNAIIALCSGKITRGEFLKNIEVAGVENYTLKKYYLDNDMDLNEVAGPRNIFGKVQGEEVLVKA